MTDATEDPIHAFTTLRADLKKAIERAERAEEAQEALFVWGREHGLIIDAVEKKDKLAQLVIEKHRLAKAMRPDD